MKKSTTANIKGRIYYIDEDAYNLLQTYLTQLLATFKGKEGEEIVDDIETRIAEHFAELIDRGASVIVIEDVNRVIEIIGRPEDLNEEEPAMAAAGAQQSPPPFASAACPPPPPVQPVRKLYRDTRHAVFGGVLAGLGQYLNWNVTVMRIFLVVLTLCFYFWPCILAYLVAWMVIPAARTPRQVLEMQGQPVNLDTVGQTVINNITPPPAPVPRSTDSSWFVNNINTVFSVCAKVVCGLVGFASGIVTVAFFFGAVAVICAMIATMFGSYTLIEGMGIVGYSGFPVGSPWFAFCLLVSLMMPFMALTWGCACVVLNVKWPPLSTTMALIILEIVLVTATILLGIYIGFSDSSSLFGVPLVISTIAVPTVV